MDGAAVVVVAAAATTPDNGAWDVSTTSADTDDDDVFVVSRSTKVPKVETGPGLISPNPLAVPNPSVEFPKAEDFGPTRLANPWFVAL